jgi:tetraacyldisaccharide 4'-kinase
VRVGEGSEGAGGAESTLEEVGDEALVCAQALVGTGVVVVAGRSRQGALAQAAAFGPDVIVLDGPLRIDDQQGGRGLSLLAVDADRPWGSGRLPPAGDLKADRAALLACADLVVPVSAMPTAVRWAGAARAPVATLRGRRVGLFTALGRPDRLVGKLRSVGVELGALVAVADHGPLTRRARSSLDHSSVRDWLATAKCAIHLRGVLDQERLGVLDGEVSLDPAVRAALRQLILAR